MTAQSILVQAEAAGLTLRPNGDNIGIKPVARLTPELKQAIAACKPEVLALLRGQRQAEVSTALAQAFARLGNMYDGDLVGTLWARITTEHPALARTIDVAEQAADLAALTYQQGEAPDSSAFTACLATWERAWAEAIGAITSRACTDCGQTDAAIMVTTDTGRFCRRCLRPEPLNRRAPHA